MQFQFQLRTPFIILTTVAVTVGINLGFIKLTGSSLLFDGWLSTGLSLIVWTKVPHAVVCVLGIKWILERSKENTTYYDRFVLIALFVNLIWNNLLIDSLLFYLVRILIAEADVRFFLQNLVGFTSGVINAACWLLMILAFLWQTKPEKTASSKIASAARKP